MTGAVKCPCCGSTVSHPCYLWDASTRTVSGMSGEVRRLTPQEAVVFDCLDRTNGRVVEIDHLINGLYGEMDEPENAVKVLQVVICRLRKKLIPMGVKIQNVFGSGYRITLHSGGRAMNLDPFRVDFHADTAGVDAGQAEHICYSWHPLPQESCLGFDVSEDCFASIAPFIGDRREHNGDEVNLSDCGCVHAFVSELIQPPAAHGRDISGAAGGHGRAQGDCSRCPVSSDPVQHGECHLADVNETVFVPSSLGPTGLAGFGRQAAFLPARDDASTTIVRREPHQSISVVILPMCEVEHTGGMQWTESHPQARVNHPRAIPEAM